MGRFWTLQGTDLQPTPAAAALGLADSFELELAGAMVAEVESLARYLDDCAEDARAESLDIYASSRGRQASAAQAVRYEGQRDLARSAAWELRDIVASFEHGREHARQGIADDYSDAGPDDIAALAYMAGAQLAAA